MLHVLKIAHVSIEVHQFLSTNWLALASSALQIHDELSIPRQISIIGDPGLSFKAWMASGSDRCFRSKMRMNKQVSDGCNQSKKNYIDRSNILIALFSLVVVK